MTDFRERQIELLAASGWARCPPVAALVADAGLPPVTPAYLDRLLTPERAAAAEAALAALAGRFAVARFAGDVSWGLLLVPDPARHDTRGPVPSAVRRDQHADLHDDVTDPRLGPGTMVTPADADWTPVATVVGSCGPSLGSYQAVVGAPAEAFTVDGVDTRTLMVRQLWGARVLQAGHGPFPDCEWGERWTFTLLPGEPLIDGLAESGTVLKGRVRFRLGKPDRGIGPARVAPAVLV